MAQTYTLDEAAGRLSLSAEEFKRRLKDDWKQIRSFRDGATLRFRSADIDELARVMGEASDPGLQPGEAPTAPDPDSSEDFLLAPDAAGASGPSSGLIRPEDMNSSADFVLPTPDPSNPKVGKPKPNIKPPSDSDIRIEADGSKRPGSSSEHSLPTEEISLDLSGPGSAVIKPGQSGKLPPPKSSGKLSPPKPSGAKLGPPPASARIPGPAGSGIINPMDGSSEFELSLDADSDSFELQLAGDDNSESEIGGLELAPPAEGHGGLSGINLGKPADSGLSLESGKPKKGIPSGPKSSKILPKPPAKPPATSAGNANPLSDSDVDFELAVDSGGRGVSGLDSDSEFELTLDDSGPRTALPGEPPKTSGGAAARGAGDIYETDFELPQMDDSASEVIAMDEASSEFDLALSDADVQPDDSESASQVVLVDDDASLVDDDAGDVLAEDHEEPVAGPGSGIMRDVPSKRRRRDDDEDEDEDLAAVRSVPAAPAQWGKLPALVMFPTLLFVFLGGLMSFEMLRGMWGYHQPSKPSSMLLEGMADAFGMK